MPAVSELLTRAVLVSDARSGRIYSITPNAKVELFATVPLAAGQTGLRQIALAPPGWGRYSGHLFVSIAAGEVAVLDNKGVVVGKITGLVAPRSLRFTELGGVPSLLIGETGASLRLLYRAGPEHIVAVP